MNDLHMVIIPFLRIWQGIYWFEYKNNLVTLVTEIVLTILCILIYLIYKFGVFSDIKISKYLFL